MQLRVVDGPGSIPTNYKKCFVTLTLKCIKKGAVPKEKKYRLQVYQDHSNDPAVILDQTFMFKLPSRNTSKVVRFTITKHTPILFNDNLISCRLTSIDTAKTLRVMQIQNIVLELID